MNDNSKVDDAKNLPPFSFSFSIRPYEQKDEKTTDNIVEIYTPPSDKTLEFNRIAHNYVTVLQMLWKYLQSIYREASSTSFTNIISLPLLLHDIEGREKKATKEDVPICIFDFHITSEDDEGNPKAITRTSKVYDREHFDKLIKVRDYHNAALRILHETVIQQIVNSYEKILGDVIRWQLNNDPSIGKKDQAISYKDILSFGSFDDVKEHVIDKEIEDFLKGKSTEEQLKYLNDTLGVDIASHFPNLPEFKEFLLRRHAIVHAGGIATIEYLRRVKKIANYNGELISEGKILPLSHSYVTRGWNNAYSMGIILLHLIAKNNARSHRSKEDEDSADSLIVQASFTNIQNDQLDASEQILRYANKLRLATESSNLMVSVNLAQTLLWQGKEQECFEVLDEHDWSACNSNFQLCVAALRNDIANFKKTLSEVANQRSLSRTELFEWPVFRKIRENENFNEWIDEVFGEDQKQVSNMFEPMLLDFDTKQRLQKVYDYYESKHSDKNGE